MSGNYYITLPTKDLVVLLQAAEGTIHAISEADPSSGVLPGLTAARDTLAHSLKAVQDAVWGSITRPDPVAAFETFVDNYGEINGG